MKIACVQMTSKLNPGENLPKLRQYFKVAREEECQAIFLPEVYWSKGDGSHQTPYLVTWSNDHFRSIQNLVKEYGLYLLGGSVIFDEEHVNRNRVINFSPEGEVLNYYDKINLFSCHLKGERSLVIDERDLSTPGDKPVLLDVGSFRIGFSVCFDLRFPNLYRYYRHQGAHILSISSAFTSLTGEAHWHTLVRARAIENQCYVIASCQWGQHNTTVESYGHSLVVDPWGTVMVDGGTGEGVFFAELDLEEVLRVRDGINLGL